MRDTMRTAEHMEHRYLERKWRLRGHPSSHIYLRVGRYERLFWVPGGDESRPRCLKLNGVVWESRSRVALSFPPSERVVLLRLRK